MLSRDWIYMRLTSTISDSFFWVRPLDLRRVLILNPRLMARTSVRYVTYIIPIGRNVNNRLEEDITIVKKQRTGQKIGGPAGADVVESEEFVGLLEGCQGRIVVGGNSQADQSGREAPVFVLPISIAFSGDDVRVPAMHHEMKKRVEGAVVSCGAPGKGLPEGRKALAKNGGEAVLDLSPDAGDAVLQEYPLSARQWPWKGGLQQGKEFPLAATLGGRSRGGGHLLGLKPFAEEKATPRPVEEEREGEYQALVGVDAGSGLEHDAVHGYARLAEGGKGVFRGNSLKTLLGLPLPVGREGR